MESKYYADMSELRILDSGLEIERDTPDVWFGNDRVVDTKIFQKSKSKKGYRILKRGFDIVVSLAALGLLAPVFLITAIAIKVEDGGPVIHKRYCVGKKGTYIMYKFRSMRVDADKLIESFSKEQKERYFCGEKLKDDFRITKVGSFIRRSSIDELPQLISVLKGDMSLVGPRPVIEREAEEYGDEKEKLFEMRSGITGIWQVYGRGTVPFLSEEAKKMQLAYVEECNFFLDLKLMLQTVCKVLKREGAR